MSTISGLAQMQFESLSGERAIGGCRLRFRISAYVNAHPEGSPTGAIIGTGELLFTPVGQGPQFVGRIFTTDGLEVLKATAGGQKTSFGLTVDLEPSRFAGIEALRQGRELALTVRLAFVVHHGDGVARPAMVDIPCRVPVSDWLNVLEQTNFAKSLLIEVHAPDSNAPAALADAFKHLAEAKDHYTRGKWRATVAACRDVMESLAVGSGDPIDGDPAWQHLVDDRTTLPRVDRFRLLRRAFRHYTHLAHHSSPASAGLQWEQEDARLALGIAAALVNRYEGSPI